MPRSWENKIVELKFNASNYKTEVWINDQVVGFHEGGYSSFKFRVDRLLKPGEENTIITRGVDKVLKALEDGGIDKNTIVVFLSDNGGAANNGSRNEPLRGKKGDLFEGGIRVPFAIRWTGVIPEGQTYNKPISSLDIMATIKAQTDVKINPMRPLDGVDLTPFLTGENAGTPHDYLFWRKWEQNAMAVRHGNHKLVANRQQEQNPPELYNILLDGSETNNIKSSQKEISENLLLEWQNWNSKMKDRVFPTLGADEWW